MALTRDDYHGILDALAPPGQALPREPDSTWQRLLGARAGAFQRVDAHADLLLEEADPRTTYGLLSDWERAFGLPDPCVTGEQTVAERRGGLMRVLTGTGGSSRAYFIALAEALGYEISIEEYTAHTVNDTVDVTIYGIAWRWAWLVRGPAVTVSYMAVNSGVNEPLSSWGNERLECVFSRAKPAHTHLLHAYGEL